MERSFLPIRQCLQIVMLVMHIECTFGKYAACYDFDQIVQPRLLCALAVLSDFVRCSLNRLG